MTASVDSAKWESRPVVARSIRGFVLVAPILLSIVAVIVVGRIVPRPASTLATIGWWIGLTVMATIVLWSADRFFRRLLPIVALFKLSLVFPDRAPSRFKTAMRRGTVRQLQRQLESGEYSETTPQDAAEQLIALAGSLNAHDRLTRGHTERVRAYSVMIGEEMGLDRAELELLNWSGLVHDIGKLAVPPEILNKPGRPTDEEWASLREHPAKADALIEPLRSWLGEWAESATQHHERYDGGGYPNGVSGDDITLAGRIVAVADAYDVMTSTRSYKKAMPAPVAREELAANSGTQFDPHVVRAFLNVGIGRLRLVMGPLSSLVQFPAGSASLGSAAVTGAGAVASVATAGLLGLVGPAVEPPPAEVAFVETAVVEPVAVGTAVDDIGLDATEDEPIEVDLAALADGPVRTIELIGQPEHGTATLSDADVVVYRPPADFHGTVDVGFRVCFDDGSCDDGVITIVVMGVNDDPVAVPDEVSMLEDSTAEVDVLANDRDVDGDELRITAIRVIDLPPGSWVGGEARIEDGRVVVEPEADAWGSMLLEYTISDPAGAIATSTVTVDVAPVNDAPVAVRDSLAGYENTAVALDVLANDRDVDGDRLTIVTVSDVSGGAATTDGAVVTFVPHPRYVGPAGFSYTITDGSLSATAEVDITIVDITGTPLLTDDAVTIAEGASATIDVLANDVVVPATLDLATVTVLSAPQHGTTAWNGTTFDYVPAAEWSGVDTFDYLVCDVFEFCNVATVTITVTPVNDAPSFVGGADQLVLEDSGPRTVAGWATAVGAGPVDESAQAVSFTVTTTNPGLFAVLPAVDGAGTLTYAPGPDAAGTATITVTARDDGGTANGGVDTSAPVTATITVTPVNDDPIAVDDGPSVTEDDLAGVTFDALANDSDVDGDTVQYGSADTSTVVNGTITDHLDGTFTYVPDAHFSGTEALSYTAIDGNGGSATATITITVVAQPDAPVATNDARVTLVDTALVVPAPGVLVNDYDVDGESLTVSTTPIAPPSNGAVVLGADGSYTYTPSGGYVGTDTFTYEISDPGGLTSTATVTVTVDSGVTAQTYYLGDAGIVPWSYDLVGAPPPSSAPVFDSDGDGDPGLTIDKSGGSEGEADPTKFQQWAVTAATPLELDGPVTLDLWSSVEFFETDEDSHPHVYLYDCLGVVCTKLAETDVHTNDWNQGVADFTNRQIDLGSVTHTVPAGRDLVVRLQFGHERMWLAMTADYPSALTLTLANQAPVAAADATTVDEDDPATNITVLANDTDTDIDPTSVAVTVPATSGTATPLGDGTIDYTPDPDTNGSDSFTYQVCDLGGNCDTATVTVTVDPVNDAPSFTGGGAVVAAGLGPTAVPGWATAISPGPADESGQLLTFVVTGNDNPAIFTTGPIIDATTGLLTFNAVSSGVASITVQLTDNGGTANGGDDTSPSYNFTITIP